MKHRAPLKFIKDTTSKVLLALLVVIAGMVSSKKSVSAYPIAQSKPLSQAEADAELIIKAKVKSSKRLEEQNQYGDTLAVLETISILKGSSSSKEISVAHIDNPPKPTMFINSPGVRRDHFEVGKTYLVLLKQAGAVYTPIREDDFAVSKISPEGFGLFLSPDDSAVSSDNFRKALWDQIKTYLDSTNERDVLYGMTVLSIFGSLPNKDFFPEKNVSDLMVSVLDKRSTAVKKMTLEMLGQLGSGSFSLGSCRDNGFCVLFVSPNFKTRPSSLFPYVSTLIKLSEEEPSDELRAKALTILAEVDMPEVRQRIETASNQTPALRKAAAIVASSLDNEEKILRKLANDSDETVRSFALAGIGAGNYQTLIPLLGEELNRPNTRNLFRSSQYAPNPAAVAACALTLFEPMPLLAQDIMVKLIDNERFGDLFAITLAQYFKGAYRDRLVKIAESKNDSAVNCQSQLLNSIAQQMLQRQ